MADKGKVSQKQFILEYFLKRPHKVIRHSTSKQEIEAAYFAAYGKRLEDSDRAIRSLFQEGYLIKVAKGQYMYDPDAVKLRDDLEDFNEATKKLILKRDGYQCVVCGLGKSNGVAVHVDHIVAKEFGGQATVENGQTLCASHNFQKQKFGQLEFAKKLFIRIYTETSGTEDEDSKVLNNFSKAILEVFESHHIDDHVKWHKPK
jgi:hypothetical protein